MRIDSTWTIRVFVAVAQTLSFSKAAEQLQISQPAVSRHIGGLEQALGVPLIDRTRPRMALTEAGQVLLRRAQSLLPLIDDTADELTSMARQIAGPLSLGATNVWEYLLPRCLGAFHRRYPKVTLGLTIRSTEEIANLLIQSAIGLGFVAYDPQRKELEALPILEHKFVLIAPRGHPLSKQARVSPRELNGKVFVRRSIDLARPGPYQYLDYLQELGVVPKLVFDLGSIDAVKGAVRSGLGLAMLSELAVKDELDHGVLSQVCLDAPSYRRTLYVLRNRYRFFSPTQQAFVAHVKKWLDSLRQSPGRRRRGVLRDRELTASWCKSEHTPSGRPRF